ncbi:MAG: DUF998 domain-containing protein [Fervidicoccaceae archaeon]
MKGVTRFLGILTFIVAFFGIALSIYLNPWFSITKNALSDLGRVGLEKSYIFNWTLIISSILALLYSFHLSSAIPGKLGCIGVGIYIVGAFSLMGIGLFPEGTGPHYFVSLEFFILMSASLLIFGVSLARHGKKSYGYALIGLFLLSFLGSYFIAWPSVAMLELYNIFCYFAGFLIIYKL